MFPTSRYRLSKKITGIRQLFKTLIIHEGILGSKTHKIVHVSTSEGVNAVCVGEFGFVNIRAIFVCVGSVENCIHIRVDQVDAFQPGPSFVRPVGVRLVTSVSGKSGA